MTEQKQKIEGTFIDAQMLKRIKRIIKACGNIPLKEKVTYLYLSVDYIFEMNAELRPALTGKVTIH